MTANLPEAAILPRAGGSKNRTRRLFATRRKWLRRPGKAREAGAVADWLEVAGNSADYETNPIVRQASREAVFPPIFHGLALPSVGKTGAGAGFLR